MVTKKKTTKKKTTKKTTKPQVTREQLQAEADKIVNEMLAHNGIAKDTEIPADKAVDEPLGDKVDEFFKSIEKDLDETEVPLDWQPTMNVLTRMYETGEEKYNCVSYRNKKIIVKLPKTRYNPTSELARIKFQVANDAFRYTVTGDNEADFEITLSLN